MNEKRSTLRRLNILLATHALLFVLGWLAALYQLSTLNNAFDSFDNTTRLIGAVLLWTPVLALHVGLHLYARRWVSPNVERTAYREGYADALRQFADRAFAERPLEQDAERLIEMPLDDLDVQRKRSG